jgi:hypothetical protein
LAAIMIIPQTIFVINLEHRTDRRKAMQKQLSRIGWHGEFFSAIRPDNPAGFPSIGAHGCFLSHLEILRRARDANTKLLVILEDDLDFAEDFAGRWRTATAELEKNAWSIFYPGHGIDHLPSGLTMIPSGRGVPCTHFMVINGDAIADIVVGLEAILSRPAGHPLGGPMHVDGAYSTIRSRNASLTTYAYFPVLGHQRPSRTDVGEVKWFDRVGALGPIVSFARKLRPIGRT